MNPYRFTKKSRQSSPPPRGLAGDFAQLDLDGSRPRLPDQPHRTSGQSAFEQLLFSYPPVASVFLCHLTTRDILCLRDTSYALSKLVGYHPRYLANIVILRRGHELWKEDLAPGSRDPGDLSALPEVLSRALVETWRDQAPTVLEELEEEACLIRCLLECFHGMPVEALDALNYWKSQYRSTAQELWQSRGIYKNYRLQTQYSPGVQTVDVQDWFQGFIGEDLRRLLASTLPAYGWREPRAVGTFVKTLVLDGTAIDTAELKLILRHTSDSLQGLSVKFCRYIDSYVYLEWLLQHLWDQKAAGQKPTKRLKWLSLWASGNFQRTFKHMDQPPPLPYRAYRQTHSETSDCKEYERELSMERGAIFQHMPWLFANYPQLDHHRKHTLPLLLPQHLCGEKLEHYRKQLSKLIETQLEDASVQLEERRAAGLVPAPGSKATRKEWVNSMWKPPRFPFGQPHPIIALFSMAVESPLKLDIAYCVNRHYCFSYIARNRTQETPGVGIHLHIAAQTGVVVPIPHPIPDDAVELNTHSLAEVGGRRARGGQRCVNCHLWEDELAAPKHCEGPGTQTFAGITTGPGIGIGREVVGSVCLDCEKGMTCAECGHFYCSNCLYPDLNKPENPLMIDNRNVEFLSVYCAQGIHGPHCWDCLRTNTALFFQCPHCPTTICLQCYPPSGVQVDTNLYGGRMDEETHEGSIVDLWRHPFQRFPAFSQKLGEKGREKEAAAAKKMKDSSEGKTSRGEKAAEEEGEEGEEGEEEEEGEESEEDEEDEIPLVINTVRHFEICAGCNDRVCGRCLGYHLKATPLGNNPTPDTERFTCYQCGGRFCSLCDATYVRCECGNGICEKCARVHLYEGIGILEDNPGVWGCWEVGGPSMAAHMYEWGKNLEVPDDFDPFDEELVAFGEFEVETVAGVPMLRTRPEILEEEQEEEEREDREWEKQMRERMEETDDDDDDSDIDDGDYPGTFGQWLSINKLEGGHMLGDYIVGDPDDLAPSTSPPFKRDPFSQWLLDRRDTVVDDDDEDEEDLYDEHDLFGGTGRATEGVVPGPLGSVGKGKGIAVDDMFHGLARPTRPQNWSFGKPEAAESSKEEKADCSVAYEEEDSGYKSRGSDGQRAVSEKGGGTADAASQKEEQQSAQMEHEEPGMGLVQCDAGLEPSAGGSVHEALVAKPLGSLHVTCEDDDEDTAMDLG